MTIFEIQLNDDDEEKYNLRFGAADEMNTEIIFWCCCWWSEFFSRFGEKSHETINEWGWEKSRKKTFLE